MSALSRAARAEIAGSGIRVDEYVREWFGDDPWGGDRCGCPDDRCRGHHHDADEECGCLATLLADARRDAVARLFSTS